MNACTNIDTDTATPDFNDNGNNAKPSKEIAWLAALIIALRFPRDALPEKYCRRYAHGCLRASANVNKCALSDFATTLGSCSLLLD